MRGWVLILAFFSVVGIGGGAIAFVFMLGSRGLGEAFYAGLVPALIGVVSTSGLVVTMAVDQARKDITAKLGGRQ